MDDGRLAGVISTFLWTVSSGQDERAKSRLDSVVCVVSWKLRLFGGGKPLESCVAPPSLLPPGTRLGEIRVNK